MTNVTRTSIAALLVLVAAVADAGTPNVVILLADDMGWGDLSLHGNSNLATPHLDALARNGAQFENFYVCQVCAPTRAEFLTGRYYPRTGVSGVSEGQGRLNPDELIIADVFRSAGYVTGAFGKWHNGTQPPFHPRDRGFDEFYGFTSGHWGHYFSPPLDHNRMRVRGRGFLADDITDHALSFIEANKSDSFFCYVPFNTPHSPMMVPDRFYEKFDGAELTMHNHDPAREDVLMTRAALALCENLDWNVGRILERLRELNLEQGTLVVFFSDNGPNSWRWNGGMKGRKGAIDEGGLRSPCFFCWPKKIAAGTVISDIAGGIDLLPTICGLTGTPMISDKPVDGIDLSQMLVNPTHSTSTPSNRLLFSIRRDRVSVRSQRFRLDGQGKLFDIEHDRSQAKNVASAFPDVAASLRGAAEQYRKEMAECFEQYRVRPFTVGYGALTTLPARDGVAHGNIRRSSKAPNNSFFVDWTSEEDFISWHVDIGATGTYEVVVHYTCPDENTGCRLSLTDGRDARVESVILEPFDPPLYDKSKERVLGSHYFVKDFKPLRMGTVMLQKGGATLRLSAEDLRGGRAIDVHSIDVNRVDFEATGD